jgi:predicted nucleotidyltransferase
MIGATAREAILGYKFGIKGPATRDLDFGVLTSSWKDFEELTDSLTSTGKFQKVKNAFHKLSSDLYELKIDIIPFGKIENPRGKIRWDYGLEMTVSGFSEAYEDAWKVKFAEKLIVDVVSPLGLALLKLISWNDRKANRDAGDFWRVAKHYLDLGNYNRLHLELPDLQYGDDYDIAYAGAVMLGRDLFKISREITRSNLRAILTDNKKIEQLAIAIHTEIRSIEANYDQMIKILEGVRVGFGNQK